MSGAEHGFLQPNPALFDLENRKRKPGLAHELGAGAKCAKCGEACPGFQLHFWRKVCINCRCGKAEHNVVEESDPGFYFVGKIFDRPLRTVAEECTFIYADVVEEPVTDEQAKKDVVLDWVPPGISPTLASKYMKSVPVERLAISGSEGATRRKKALEKQFPLHDVDPSECHDLSKVEINSMTSYIDNVKKNIAGQGIVYQVGCAQNPEQIYENLPPPLPANPPPTLPSSSPPSSFPPPPPDLLDVDSLTTQLQNTDLTQPFSKHSNEPSNGTFHAKPYNVGDSKLKGPKPYGKGGLEPYLRVGSAGSSLTSSPSPPQGNSPTPEQGGLRLSRPSQYAPSSQNSQSGPRTHLPSSQNDFPAGQNKFSVNQNNIPANDNSCPINQGHQSGNDNSYPANQSQKSGNGHAYPNNQTLQPGNDNGDPGNQNNRRDIDHDYANIKTNQNEKHTGGPNYKENSVSSTEEHPTGPGVMPGVDGEVWDCSGCRQPMEPGEVAIFAERAGEDKCWHPSCFNCSRCGEMLEDLLYFFSNNELYCGRDFAEMMNIPRCAACDELIFAAEYTGAEDRHWHLKHFCCWMCDRPLAGHKYIPVDGQPHCLMCWQSTHGKVCSACNEYIGPEEQRVTLGDNNWHTSPACFRCGVCSVSLMGGKMSRRGGVLLCSSACAKKLSAAQPNATPQIPPKAPPIAADAQRMDSLPHNYPQSLQQQNLPQSRSANVSQQIYDAPTNSQHISPNPQHISPNSQHVSPTSQQVSPTSQQVSPNSQKASPNSRHVSPNSQHAPPNSQHAPPNSQHAPPNSQHAPPTSQYISPNSQQVPPNSQHAPPTSQSISPNSQQISPNSQQISPKFQQYVGPPTLRAYGTPISNYGSKSQPYGGAFQPSQQYEGANQHCQQYGGVSQHSKSYEGGSQHTNPGIHNQVYGVAPRHSQPYGGYPKVSQPYGGPPLHSQPYGGAPQHSKPYGGTPQGSQPYGGTPQGSQPYVGAPQGSQPYGGAPLHSQPYGGHHQDSLPGPPVHIRSGSHSTIV